LPFAAAMFSNDYGFLFVFLIIVSLAMAAGLFVVAPMIKRMMDRDAAATAEDDSNKEAALKGAVPKATARDAPKKKG